METLAKCKIALPPRRELRFHQQRRSPKTHLSKAYWTWRFLRPFLQELKLCHDILKPFVPQIPSECVQPGGGKNGKLLLNLPLRLKLACQAPTLSEKAAPAWCALWFTTQNTFFFDYATTQYLANRYCIDATQDMSYARLYTMSDIAAAFSNMFIDVCRLSSNMFVYRFRLSSTTSTFALLLLLDHPCTIAS